jgi:hypothetical protein
VGVAVLQKAHQHVWDVFCNLDEAWMNKALRVQWLQLTPEAVDRLLRNPNLSGTSENVVYVVVASWLAAKLR